MRSDYLLDTSVLSELAPGRRRADDEVDAWVLLNEHRFHLSVVSIAEIIAGVTKLRRAQELVRADAYEAWVGQTIDLFGPRLLGFELAVARQTGELLDHARSEGIHPGFADIAIAATAKHHGLTILTRNLRHFVPLEVPCVDPFESR